MEYEEDTTEIDYGGNIPQAIKQAMLLLLGTWYQQREGASDAKGFRLPLPPAERDPFPHREYPGMSRIGELNDRIIIKRETRTTDGMGGWTTTKTTLATVWSKVKIPASSDGVVAGADSEIRTHVVRVRQNATTIGVQINDLITWRTYAHGPGPLDLTGGSGLTTTARCMCRDHGDGKEYRSPDKGPASRPGGRSGGCQGGTERTVGGNQERRTRRCPVDKGILKRSIRATVAKKKLEATVSAGGKVGRIDTYYAQFVEFGTKKGKGTAVPFPAARAHDEETQEKLKTVMYNAIKKGAGG